MRIVLGAYNGCTRPAQPHCPLWPMPCRSCCISAVRKAKLYRVASNYQRFPTSPQITGRGAAKLNFTSEWTLSQMTRMCRPHQRRHTAAIPMKTSDEEDTPAQSSIVTSASSQVLPSLPCFRLPGSAVAVSFQAGLLNGGPTSLVWGMLLSWVGITAVAASLAEMASINPSVGAQYFLPF